MSEATSAPDVAVLIVNWNTRDLLADCLRSVAEAARELAVQTVVADNASSDGSVEMLRARFPLVETRALTDNLGFVGGNNLAYADVRPGARYVLLLNPDAELGAGALQAMVAWMDAHAEAGACGPLTLNSDGTLQCSWTRFPTVWSEIRGCHNRRFPGRTQPAELSAEAIRRLPSALRVDWVSGACLLLRRQALTHDLGDVLFDSAFHMYSEETDLCYRLYRAGWPTFFVPQAEVVHHYGQSSKQAPVRTLRLLYGSKLLFFRKHYGPVRLRLLQLGVGLTASLKWLLYAFLSLFPLRAREKMAHQRARQKAILETLHQPSQNGQPRRA